jgi:hypothetical protein
VTAFGDVTLNAAQAMVIARAAPAKATTKIPSIRRCWGWVLVMVCPCAAISLTSDLAPLPGALRETLTVTGYRSVDIRLQAPMANRCVLAGSRPGNAQRRFVDRQKAEIPLLAARAIRLSSPMSQFP